MEVSVAEAKARLSELINTVVSGEKVIITKHGKQIAELRAAATQKQPIEKLTMFRRIQREAGTRTADSVTSSNASDFLYNDDGLPQ